MISENILGEKRKWQSGHVHWEAQVVAIASPNTAKVQLTGKNGKDKSTTLHTVTWTAGELSDHGFEIGLP